MAIRSTFRFTLISIFALVIAFILNVQVTRGDALPEVSEADAKRIASLIKPGDVLLYLCRSCSDLSLTARKVLSVQVIPPEKLNAPKTGIQYRSDLFPYRVNVTQDLFFVAKSILETKALKQVSADGKCMIPVSNEIAIWDQRCYDYIGDSNEASAFRCKEDAYLNYTYFLQDGSWRNFATVTRDDKDIKSAIDVVRLSAGTWQKIEQCRQIYESSLPKSQK